MGKEGEEKPSPLAAYGQPPRLPRQDKAPIGNQTLRQEDQDERQGETIGQQGGGEEQKKGEKKARLLFRV